MQPIERIAWGLLVFHIAISVFGLVGIAIMIPNPQIWAGSPTLVAMFPPSMQWGGNLQIITGAAALLAYGVVTVGVRATTVFFVVSCAISLTFELTGTSFGIPFGSYKYTDLFGIKIIDKVPPAIPLSWFYMGFASFLIAKHIVHRWSGVTSLWPAVILGSILLTAWDVVLDPAMSHSALALRYWEWIDTGPYMGMPLINLVGWVATGVLFMGLASMLDKTLTSADVERTAMPLILYLANMLFAIGVCAGTGLWLPTILGVIMVTATLFVLFGPAPAGRPARGEV